MINFYDPEGAGHGILTSRAAQMDDQVFRDACCLVRLGDGAFLDHVPDGIIAQTGHEGTVGGADILKEAVLAEAGIQEIERIAAE